MNLRRLARLAIAGAALLLMPSPTRCAQSGTIHFIIGTAPGGAIDPYARIDRRPDGEDARPDHHRREQARRERQHLGAVHRRPAGRRQYVWIGTQAFTEINPNAFKNLRWSIDDFIPFIRGVEAPLVFVVHPDVPAKTFAEFLAWAKANRGKLSYSSYQPGTPSHFLGYPAEREVRSRPHPRALSRLGLAGHRDGRRPLAVRLRAGELHGAAASGRQAPHSRGSPGRAGTARCRTCRPSPSSAIRNSPRRCGSACW